MKNHVYPLVVLGVLIAQLCRSQQVQGHILDPSGDPLSDAFIHSSSKDVHSHSNAQGHFVLLNAQAGDTIYLSYLGYKTIEHVLDAEDFKRDMTFVMEEIAFDLDQVRITNSVKTVGEIAVIDLQTQSVSSSQEVLRRVPGLFIGQHAGGGKAEQIFLRGFDIDHGTDIAIRVDGLPVNMVSHAHGQGYADLHFLIPETIDHIDFGKGPYYSEHGNFVTAGYVDFTTKNALDENSIGVEYGDFNSLRMVGLVELLGQKDREHAYIATEYRLSDGPFDTPQHFNRVNIMGKYTLESNRGDRLSVMLSTFQSKWDASGQIPQRLVDAGTISRFGAVDDTEGGQTSRSNISVNHTKALNDAMFLKTNAFFSHYDFELFSNFTFFLEDPVNGDQIRQFEDRNIYGVRSVINQSLYAGRAAIELNYGLDFRYDDIDENTLTHTRDRKTTLDSLALGNVDEVNIQAFADAQFDFGDWLINPGIQFNVFRFDYIDVLAPVYTSLSESALRFSPKLNVIYNPNTQWQFYLKSGVGFHSNDTRVVVQQGGEKILPAAYGVDLGTIWKPIERLWINAAFWHLFLEQEFVYVGDAAIVEPSGKTVRTGVDFSFRYQLAENVFVNSDVNYTKARATEELTGQDRIPLAPEVTAAGGLTFRRPYGFSGGLRYRYIKDRPANEDNSITAEGYFLVDLNSSYTFRNGVTLGLSIENLLDADWNEAQFATMSRLRNETEPTEEIHFTPGVPFFAKAHVTFRF